MVSIIQDDHLQIPFYVVATTAVLGQLVLLWTIYNIVLVLGPPCCYCLACVPNVDLLAFLVSYMP